MIDIEKLREIFFRAAQQGYAGGAPKGAIAELPRSKVIRLTFDDGYEVVDIWFTMEPESPYSFGTKIIFKDGIPVWKMSYDGHYPEGVIPFLKRALTDAYAEEGWFGGRGPHFYRDDGDDNSPTYVNNYEEPNDFRHGRGREEIFFPGGVSAGWHEYKWLLLVPTE